MTFISLANNTKLYAEISAVKSLINPRSNVGSITKPDIIPDITGFRRKIASLYITHFGESSVSRATDQEQ